MINPTKYCNVVKCTDCKHYQDCVQSEIKANEAKGKALPEIKFVEVTERK